jgi:hypothetical protein
MHSQATRAYDAAVMLYTLTLEHKELKTCLQAVLTSIWYMTIVSGVTVPCSPEASSRLVRPSYHIISTDTRSGLLSEQVYALLLSGHQIDSLSFIRSPRKADIVLSGNLGDMIDTFSYAYTVIGLKQWSAPGQPVLVGLRSMLHKIKVMQCVCVCRPLM